MKNKKNKLWSIYVISTLLIVLSLGILFASFVNFDCIGGASCESPDFINRLPFYSASVGLLFIAIFLLRYKNWARIISSAGFLLAGLWLMYLCIRNLSEYNQDWTNLIIGVICIFISGYLAFNKKVKEAFNK